MGLERLQAGEEGGDSGCAALWRDAYVFHNDYKNSPKNTACTTHCVVRAGLAEKEGLRPAALGQCRKKGRDSKSVIGIGLLALCAAQPGLTRFPGR